MNVVSKTHLTGLIIESHYYNIIMLSEIYKFFRVCSARYTLYKNFDDIFGGSRLLVF